MGNKQYLNFYNIILSEYGFEDAILKTREEAEKVLYKMEELIEIYGSATLADLYDLVGINSSYKDTQYGWTNLRNANIIKLDNGYTFRMPIYSYGVLSDDGEDDYLENNDTINHPKHYQTKNGLETIQVIDAFTDGLEGIEAVCTANVIKYICRWGKKNGLEDLKKAQWYLNYLISKVETDELIER